MSERASKVAPILLSHEGMRFGKFIYFVSLAASASWLFELPGRSRVNSVTGSSSHAQ